jgi:hypothetical protein
VDGGRSDRWALTSGLVSLAAIAIVYPVLAEEAGNPLAVFVLPSLFCAILGGWRPTLVVGVMSLLLAVVAGVGGPLEAGPLVVRLGIVASGALLGGVGAFVRDQQARRLSELGETVALREAFERALVPRPLPPAGFLAISRFRAAEPRMGLGGDFLEAVALPDGRLAILVGDVCGHGPQEAAFGSALRAGWKAIALGSPADPVQWVAALESSFFRDGRMDTFATVCTGFFDSGASVACLVNAGHPLPVRLCPSPQPLALPASAPLGINAPAQPTATEVPWTGEPVIFYTDGLIENPRLDGPTQRWGDEGLMNWLTLQVLPPDPQTFIDALMEDATAGRELRDDVAVLLVAATPPQPETKNTPTQRPRNARADDPGTGSIG